MIQQLPFTEFQGGVGGGGGGIDVGSGGGGNGGAGGIGQIPIQTTQLPPTIPPGQQFIPQVPQVPPPPPPQPQFMLNNPSPLQLRLEILKDGVENKKFFTKDTKNESQTRALVKIFGYGSIQVVSLSFDAYAVRLDDTLISKDRKEKKSYVKVSGFKFVDTESWVVDIKMTEGTLKSLAKYYLIATLNLDDVNYLILI